MCATPAPPASGWRSKLSLIPVTLAGFVAYELGLHVYIYATTRSNDAPLECAFLAGPSLASGVVAAIVTDRILARRTWAQYRARWVAGGYAVLVALLLVVVLQHVQGMTISGAVALIAGMLFISVWES